MDSLKLILPMFPPQGEINLVCMARQDQVVYQENIWYPYYSEYFSQGIIIRSWLPSAKNKPVNTFVVCNSARPHVACGNKPCSTKIQPAKNFCNTTAAVSMKI